MSSPQVPRMLKEADEFLEEMSHRYRCAKAEDQCIICHDTEGNEKNTGDTEKEDPDHPKPHDAFFQVLPCRHQPIHQHCLVKHVKGISKRRAECVHCGVKICKENPLTPRQQWEEACEEVVHRLAQEPDAKVDANLWMWTLMQSYDAGTDKPSSNADSPVEDYFNAIDTIVEAFYRDNGTDAVLCYSHQFVGKGWLVYLVSNLLRKVMRCKGAFTQDLENVLFRVRENYKRVRIVSRPNNSDNSNSSIHEHNPPRANQPTPTPTPTPPANQPTPSPTPPFYTHSPSPPHNHPSSPTSPTSQPTSPEPTPAPTPAATSAPAPAHPKATIPTAQPAPATTTPVPIPVPIASPCIITAARTSTTAPSMACRARAGSSLRRVACGTCVAVALGLGLDLDLGLGLADADVFGRHFLSASGVCLVVVCRS
ncbi:hypothetical protein PMIN04_010241 [Paraphaeosphaeria minitans]